MQPGVIGTLDTPNRMCMAPMTRFRVSPAGIPLPANAVYYGQRASAALIVSESLYVEPRGRQEELTAGIYSSEQTAAWRTITSHVHKRRGRIFAQLAHAGRLSHSSLQPGNELPIAPSPTAQGVIVRLTNSSTGAIEHKPAETPREMETDEVADMVEEFAQAAVRAIQAGFDGVEIHAGSGHLHRQFLQAASNQRSDRYGGSAKKRCTFLLDTVATVVANIGHNRVGIKIAPNFAYNGTTGDLSEIDAVYSTLCDALQTFDLAYLHVQNPMWGMRFGPDDYDPVAHVRSMYANTLLAGGEYDRQTGEAAIKAGLCDFVVYGRRFLANPDLPKRFAIDGPENEADLSTIYLPGEQGFTDYPALSKT